MLIPTAKRDGQADSYIEIYWQIKTVDRNALREKAHLRRTLNAIEVEGKIRIQRKGSSDENNNKIEIHAPQSSILAVGSLCRRRCNFSRRMRGGPLRNSV